VGFKVGQKVVYPNHGIGTIEQIEQKQIGAVALPFYTLRLAATNSLVLVPVSNASEVGLRRPITSSECDVLFQSARQRLHRSCQRLEGSLQGILGKKCAPATFSKLRRAQAPQLPQPGEAAVVSRTTDVRASRYLVVSELAAVCHQPECNIEPRVDQALLQACARHERQPNSKARVATAAAGAH